jgi:transposase InsO family protein
MQCLADKGILPLIGSAGDSHDNALMENFFAALNKVAPSPPSVTGHDSKRYTPQRRNARSCHG